MYTKSFNIDKDILEEIIIHRDNSKKFISQTSSELNSIRKGIDWWFDIFEKNQDPFQRNYLKKPICIELFEYTYLLKIVRKQISEVIIHKVNQVFKEKNRDSPLPALNRKIKSKLKEISEYLEDPRNQFAAHRYTFDSGKQYIKIKNLINILNKLSKDELINIRNELFIIHDEISDWINQNENFIPLASYKQKKNS